MDPAAVLKDFREVDVCRRQAITGAETMKARRNQASEEIAKLKKAGQDASAQMAETKQLREQIQEKERAANELEVRLREILAGIPNIPHESVPVGKGTEDNVEVRRWGAPPKFDFAPKPHWEVGERARILDLEAAAKITGARFAVYKGWGARLERALANFFLDVHTREHGYTEILPPFIVNTASLVADGKLPKFAGDMFHLEGTDLWLTTTAETELTNLYRDETLDATLLPIR